MSEATSQQAAEMQEAPRAGEVQAAPQEALEVGRLADAFLGLLAATGAVVARVAAIEEKLDALAARGKENYD